MRASFTISKRWKQLKCALVDEWMITMCYMHTVGYYPALNCNEIDTCYNVDEPWGYRLSEIKPNM